MVVLLQVPCKPHFHAPIFLLNPTRILVPTHKFYQAKEVIMGRRRKVVVRGCHGEEKSTAAGRRRRSFLSMEEAGLVEISGLSSHEKFLCRLTISSLNLLRVISEQEGIPIEKLNAGGVCDWFLKDKLKREQNLESTVLQWDDSEFLM